MQSCVSVHFVAPALAVRVSGLTEHMVGHAWTMDQGDCCRPSGCSPRLCTKERVRQRTTQFIRSPSACGAVDHVSTSVAMALSPNARFKNPHDALLLSSCLQLQQIPPPPKNCKPHVCTTNCVFQQSVSTNGT